MKRFLFMLITVVLLVGLAGCHPAASAGVVKSDKPRNTSPQIDTGSQSQLVEGNNEFAFKLYQSLTGNGGNMFFSPYSISEALAMTWAGAKGDTEKAMADALSFTLDQNTLHPAFNWLDLELAKRGQNAEGKDDKGFRLRIANAIWGQQDYMFLDSFLDTLAINYGAGLRTVDFKKDAEKSRITINDWVAAQTENRIKDLIPQGSVNPMTRMVLTNAIYFNAAWLNPFDAKMTANGTFTKLDGSMVTVPLMKQVESLHYSEGVGYQAVELPYDGRELSMVILLPEVGKYNDFESTLDNTLLKQIIGQLRTYSVTLTMPKFEYSSSFGLKDALSKLGMDVAFSDNADFSGMDGARSLFIQDVLHKAFVSVDEAGTEAAAATAVIVGLTATPESASITINRPFIYLIRDNATGSIIFLGRVMDPTTK